MICSEKQDEEVRTDDPISKTVSHIWAILGCEYKVDRWLEPYCNKDGENSNGLYVRAAILLSST